jgi:hypothetical protein
LNTTELLFCGHDSGTFVVATVLQKHLSFSGTWKFEAVPIKKSYCLQRGYMVLEKINNQWTFRNKIAVLTSSKYFEI